ncbi:hypothetical protein [Pseudoroseicyclus sp. CXY001]|uniref:hypothetical protein n=1 Tax=Pseudoroseicyclus sp. CXY001 TaxID=3242492 RepID=UPI00358DA5AD
MSQLEEAQRVVQNYSNLSHGYEKQIHVWLGIGSAGGAVALTTLAAGLSDPNYALVFIAPSLWSFLLGVVWAGLTVYFLRGRYSALSEHYAAAYNRQVAGETAARQPLVFSMPERLAEEFNEGRNKLIEKEASSDAVAEAAWLRYRIFSFLWAAALAVSTISFVVGFAIPLVKIQFLNLTIQ